MATSHISITAVPALLRGKTESLTGWIRNWEARQFVAAIVVIFLGSGLYGVAFGLWRDPWHALYVGVKFPCILLFTAGANALLNGMLAPLLGLPISFRQSLLAILMSFMIAAMILGAFSPLVFFLVMNVPSAKEAARSGFTHALIVLIDVMVISLAGLAANARLVQLLRNLSSSKTVGTKIFSRGSPVTFSLAVSFPGSFARS